MNRVDIAVVVDTEGTLAAGTLENSLYLVDTESYLGSWAEGTNSLHTICRDGQVLVWRAIAISPESDVNLISFDGEMVSSGICIVNRIEGVDGPYWEGKVQSRGSFGSYGFAGTISIDGRSFRFNGSIKVV